LKNFNLGRQFIWANVSEGKEGVFRIEEGIERIDLGSIEDREDRFEEF
jgi:hypothetical protein